MKEIKSMKTNYLNDKPPSLLSLFLVFSHIVKVKLQLKFKYLFNY
jgi:hypothetical protein